MVQRVRPSIPYKTVLTVDSELSCTGFVVHLACLRLRDGMVGPSMTLISVYQRASSLIAVWGLGPPLHSCWAWHRAACVYAVVGCHTSCSSCHQRIGAHTRGYPRRSPHCPHRSPQQGAQDIHYTSLRAASARPTLTQSCTHVHIHQVHQSLHWQSNRMWMCAASASGTAAGPIDWPFGHPCSQRLQWTSGAGMR